MTLCRVCNERETYPRKSANGPFPTRCLECKTKDTRANKWARAKNARDKRIANLEEHRTDRRGYYWENREKIRAQARERRAKIGKKELALQQRFRNSGITPAEFHALVEAQGGMCAICGTDQPGGQGGWHVDHDHRFEKNDKRGHRGLLCHFCNVGLGHFKDDLARVESAAAYLRRYIGRHVGVA